MKVETRYGRHSLTAGDILFVYDKRSFISKLIALFSEPFGKLKLSHVALFWGGSLIVDANFKGVFIRTMKQYLNLNKYNLYIGRSNIDRQQRKRLIHLALYKSGSLDYSKRQLFAIAMKQALGINSVGDWDKDAVICTEFIIDIFREINIDLMPNIDSAEVTPIDLFKSKELSVTQIFEIEEDKKHESVDILYR